MGRVVGDSAEGLLRRLDALTAYLLHLNGVIAEGDAMNAQTLPRVKMPTRDNFILAYPPPAR